MNASPVFASGDDCGELKQSYQIWDFKSATGQWSVCGKDQKEDFGGVNNKQLLTELNFAAALESNRRGLSYLITNEVGFDDRTQALTMFQHAAGLGLAEAYSNIALVQFALTNLQQSQKAAELATLLNQPEAMGLLAYFKIEAIHTERDLNGAYGLILRAEALGADLSAVKNMDMSYQFFKAHWAELQHALWLEGLFNGEINGIFGDDAKSALTSYQQINGLPVSQKIDLGLLMRLNMLQNFNQHVEAQAYVYGTY